MSGPLGEPVAAEWALLPDGVAVIEMARASGLTLVERTEPEHATTRGTGELIMAASRAGPSEILLGLGGSATVDGGVGCLAAMGFRFELMEVVSPVVWDWPTIRCACDVTNPLLGPNGAVAVYGPQKGVLDSAMAARIEERLEWLTHFTNLSPEEPMTGAAGGLAFGLAAFAGASLEGGADLVMGRLGFDAVLAEADVVVTGEGKLDSQSMQGKVVGEVVRRAEAAGRRCYAVAGTADPSLQFAVPFEVGSSKTQPAEAVTDAAARVAKLML